MRKLVAEANIEPSRIAATGKGGRLTKADVAAAKPAAAPAPIARPPIVPPPREATPREERVRMTRLRRRIAERLKEAQNTAAMLTTFNEVDMTEVMALRERYRDSFEKQHGVKLGFMSIFVKACDRRAQGDPGRQRRDRRRRHRLQESLRHRRSRSAPSRAWWCRWCATPMQLSFADIEKRVADLGRRARDGKLSLEELSGGTFTITNGGVYGSLLSTPILNPPQSAILGMHKIEKRPRVVADKIEARAMMYLALSYDHRIIDGREAVTFLVRVKECLEDPQRMLLGV